MLRHPTRRRVQVDPGEFTHTRQSHKEECDINNILAQYKKTGIIEHINTRQAQYIDLPSAVDLQTAFEITRAAESAFADLPSKVRDRFGNDPATFLAALENPDMKKELTELGVLRDRTALDDALNGRSTAEVAGVI